MHVGDLIEGPLSGLFNQYGQLVGRRPWLFIVSSVLVCFASLPGFQYISVNSDVNELFIPWNAKVRDELKIIYDYNELPPNLPFDSRTSERLIRNVPLQMEDKSDVKSDSSRKRRPLMHKPRYNVLKVFIKATNESNILTIPVFDYLQNLTTHFRNTMFEFKGKKLSYIGDICVDPCLDMNAWIYKAKRIFADEMFSRNPNIRLSYPYIRLLETKIPIDQFVYGIEVSGVGKTLTSAKILSLHFYIDYHADPFLTEASDAFVDEFYKYWDKYDGNLGLEVILLHDKSINGEMDNIIGMTVPYIGLTILILIAFVVISNLSRSAHQCKAIEAFCAVISVLLALICTFGFLFAVGLQFNVIAAVTPYLVLAIGVDDAFLILAAWRHSSTKLSVPERLGATMHECGVSITVTTLTDGLCFAIGYFACLTPAIGEFCLFTAVAITFDFLFQVTFFIAVVAIGGRKEKLEKSLCICLPSGKKVHPIKDEKDIDVKPVPLRTSQKVHPDLKEPIENEQVMSYIFRHYWGPLLNTAPVRIFAFVLFMAYISSSLYGCSTIIADMAPQKFVADDSRMLRFFTLAERYIWGDSVKARMHLMTPLDYRRPESRHRLLSFVESMETTRYSVGIESTQVWVRDYLRYMQYYDNMHMDVHFYNLTLLTSFFTSNVGQQFVGDIKFQENIDKHSLEPNIQAFAFSTNFYRLHDWDHRERLLFIWRALINEFSDMTPAVADFISVYIDQKSGIAPSTVQTIGAAIIAMSIIAGLFIPEVSSIFFVSLSLLSISCGVIGWLKIWGADLDHVSLGSILMAIGFAVDFTAHICVKFHRLSLDISGRNRLIITLGAVGWPILQAGLSTMFGVVVLSFVRAYMVRVFFQCTTLVIIFGLLHALLFLPVFQSALIQPEYIRTRKSHRLKLKPKILALDSKKCGAIVVMW